MNALEELDQVANDILAGKNDDLILVYKLHWVWLSHDLKYNYRWLIAWVGIPFFPAG